MDEVTQRGGWWSTSAGAHASMVVITAVFGVLSSLFGERVPAGGGVGWDGLTYARLTRDLATMVENGEIGSYYAQRILPPGIVRAGLLATGSAFDDAAIIRGFQVYNLGLYVGVAVLWWRLANSLSLTVRGRWTGFAGLFLTFQGSKLLFYYPVLTDTTALFLGMVLLTAYVEKRPWILLIATVLGAFAWPVASFYGACLLLFLGAEAPREVIERPFTSLRTVAAGWLASFAVAAVALPVLQLLWQQTGTGLWKWAAGPVTALPAWAGMGVALWIVAGSPAFVGEVLRSLLRPRLGIALGAIALVLPFVLVRLIANPAVPSPSGFGQVLFFTLVPPTNKVLLPLITSVAFWGPLVLVLGLRWREVAVEARRLGAGYIAVIALSLFLALANEPRYLTCGWPFFVLGAVLGLEKDPPGRAFYAAFGVLSVALAQFWLKLNIAPWTGDDNDNLTVLPKQIYFMHFGLWTGWPAFVAYSAVTALGLLWLWATLRPRPRPARPRPSAAR